MNRFYCNLIKKLPQILFMGVVVIPLDQEQQWRTLHFNKIPKHKVQFSNQGLEVKVRSSAGPLIYPFSKTLKIKKIEVSAQVDKLLSLKKGLPQGQKDNDDYILRLGFVLPGEKRLNFFQRATAANWVLELNKLGDGRKDVKGFDKVIFYNIGQRPKQKGEKRLHPLSKGLFEERTQWVIEKPGKVEVVNEWQEPISSLGLWVGIDGDNSKSQYTIKIKEIKITTNQ